MSTNSPAPSSPPPAEGASASAGPDASSDRLPLPAPAPAPERVSFGRQRRLRLGALIAIAVALLGAAVVWIVHATDVDSWLAVHTGLTDLTGPYYGFWSGIGSDIAELTLVGAVSTGVYQLVKKYNCHHPGCWRVGNHPAAGGQFYLCWRHHPDFMGGKPTKEIIAELHREHLARQEVLHARIHEIHTRLVSRPGGEPTPRGSAKGTETPPDPSRTSSP
ncbi:hypothetical protein GCM10027053_00540 [Intrasporangium mesophilum]